MQYTHEVYTRECGFLINHHVVYFVDFVFSLRMSWDFWAYVAETSSNNLIILVKGLAVPTVIQQILLSLFRWFPLFLLSCMQYKRRDSSITFFRIPFSVFPHHPRTSCFVISPTQTTNAAQVRHTPPPIAIAFQLSAYIKIQNKAGKRASGCVVEGWAWRLEGRWFDPRFHRLSD